MACDTALKELLGKTNTYHVTQSTIDGVCVAGFEDMDVHLVIFDARVKSGKLISILATIAWFQAQERNAAHIVVSAWNRRADECQRKRLESAGAAVFQLVRYADSSRAIDYINSCLDAGYDEVIIYHDELDHGSGHQQIVARFYSDLDTSDERIRRIYYSATAEELLSGAAYTHWPDDDKLHYKYKPPPEYKGAEYYLDAGLHRDVEPAIVFNTQIIKKVWSEKRRLWIPKYINACPLPSEQLQELIEEALLCMDSIRRVIVIRQHAGYELVRNAVYEGEILCDDNIIHMFSHSVHGDEIIDWSDPGAFDHCEPDKLILVWIDMECGRSTEWGIHESVYAYHNYAGETTAYNTSIQQAGRVFHYVGTKYSEPQRIILYCRKEDLELHAERLSYDLYTQRLSRRMSLRKQRSVGLVNREFEPVIVVKDIEFNGNKVAFLKELEECTGRELRPDELATMRRWSAGDTERKHKSMASMNAIVAGESNQPCGGLPKNSKTVFIEYIGAPFPLRNGGHIPAYTTFIHICKIIADEENVETPAAIHKTGKKSMYYRDEDE